jgi:protein-glucosylgalactosylhydroxylysine glucosidase
MVDSTDPISPPPVTEWQAQYLPAYLSNGLLGLRVGHIPQLYGVAMVSGFEGLDPLTGVEAFARAPYPLAGDVQIGAAALSDPGRAVLREQRYDFSCGELHTSLTLDTGEVRAEIGVVTLCSRTQPTVALQETRVRVDRDCDLTLSAGLDARDVPGSWGAVVGGPFDWRSPGELDRCGLAFDTELSGADQLEISLRQLCSCQFITIFSFRSDVGCVYFLRDFRSVLALALYSNA